MRVIGITGGVGSGKSHVAHRLQEMSGAKLLIADELGHVVMEKGKPAYDRIVEYFGDGILADGGEIDRAALAETVFQSDTAREALNQIIHPAVLQYIERFITERKEMDGLILLETALLYESGCERFCDEVWFVSVPQEERIRRLQRDRGYSASKAQAIMASQLSEEEFRVRADRVIDNAGDKDMLEEILRNMARDACSAGNHL